MIYALCRQANTSSCKAPQQCAAIFIDGRNIENEMYCFTVLYRLLAGVLQHFYACRRDFP